MSTVEYTLGEAGYADSLFLIMVDTSLSSKELKSIKTSIVEAIKELPDNVSIVFMTFSRYVTVYELVNSMFMKSIIIDGKEKITIEDIVKMLSLDKKGDVNRYV